MVVIYTLKTCLTCRKAVRWLRERGMACEERPIREQPPSKAELAAALKTAGGEPRRLCNTSGRDYRESGLKDRLAFMTNDEFLDLLSGNGNLIKRPLLVFPSGAVAGFDESAWRGLLEPSSG